MSGWAPAGPEWSEVERALDHAGFPGTRPVRTLDDGAYSNAGRWLVQLVDDERAFVKASRDPDAGLGREIATLGARLGPFTPRLIGSVEEPEADGLTVLLAEALDEAHWGTPVTEADAIALRRALDRLAAVTPPSWVVPMTDDRVTVQRSWPLLGGELRDALLALRLFGAGWLDASLPVLEAAAAELDPHGDSIVHGDLWRQNWCIADRGAIIVDWTGTSLGSSLVNEAWAECAVRAAGGPMGVVLGRSNPDHAACAAYMAGVTCRFLVFSVEHDVPTERPALWATEVREAFAALRWACQALGLPPIDPAPGIEPHGPWRP